MSNRTLFIVCGLPGSGKTTYAKKLAQELAAVRFNADEWMSSLGVDLWDGAVRDRIEKLQWEMAQSVLAAGAPCIIEWGTWAKEERDALREGAKAVDAKVELHYLKAPTDVLFERLTHRGMETPPITKAKLDEWGEVFQTPSTEELSHYDGTQLIQS